MAYPMTGAAHVTWPSTKSRDSFSWFCARSLRVWTFNKINSREHACLLFACWPWNPNVDGRANLNANTRNLLLYFLHQNDPAAVVIPSNTDAGGQSCRVLSHSNRSRCTAIHSNSLLNNSLMVIGSHRCSRPDPTLRLKSISEYNFVVRHSVIIIGRAGFIIHVLQ